MKLQPAKYSLWKHYGHRFSQYTGKPRRYLQTGKPGKIVHLNARFSFQAPFDPVDRKFNLALGGGSLLDIGIYPVIDALYFMGVPSQVMAKASFSRNRIGRFYQHNIRI